MKIHVNSVISGVTSIYMCMDVNYFYLNSMIDRAEYIMINISMITQNFWKNTASRKKCTMGTCSHG